MSELRTEIYIEDCCIGYLYLSKQGDFSYEWSDAWFADLEFAAPFAGIPTAQRGRITGQRVNWIFDTLYLPKTTGNIRRALLVCGLDADDHSLLNIRRILFAKPYREYSIAFGAPCSHFSGPVSYRLSNALHRSQS